MGRENSFPEKMPCAFLSVTVTNHASPNSAQTEAACAGALHLRLAGDASYFGKIVKKPFIGDDLRPVEAEDIVRVNVLLYRSAVIGEILCLLALLVVTLFL